MESWRSDDLAGDEIKNLSRMVVDFARSRGLRDADDDDLLQIVTSAYLAGRKSGAEGVVEFISRRGPVQ
jgi:hypothetical protein